MKISTVVFVCLLAFLFVIHSASGAIQWNGNWAFGCDFYENNSQNIRVRGEECGPRCDASPTCTHFTWTTYNGGTCWMKRGAVTKDNAFETNDKSMVCGVSI